MVDDECGDPVRFVVVSHKDEEEGDMTAVGMQDTPKDWGLNRKRSGMGAPITDNAPTQPESFVLSPNPPFVRASDSNSDVFSPHRMDEVDEDETQIKLSLSQDLERTRSVPRQIEEEQLNLSTCVATSHLNKTQNNSFNDADSDMSDDMLEQDGDINALAIIAATLQEQDEAPISKRPTMRVFKARTPPFPMQDDDSSGAETEVESEPELSQSRKAHLANQVPSKTEEVTTIRLTESIQTQQRREVVSAANKGGDNNPLQLREVDTEHDENSELIKRNERKCAPQAVQPDTTNCQDKEVVATIHVDHLIEDIMSKTCQEKPQDDFVKSAESPKAKNIKRKRLIRPSSADEADDDANEDTSQAKGRINRKRRLLKPTKVDQKFDSKSISVPTVLAKAEGDVHIMFTGLDGTIPKLRGKVKKIRGAIVEDEKIEIVTHLVAQKNLLKRTVKLLCGISLCDHVVDERWLDESARLGYRADEKKYCLHDSKAEEKFQFSLYQTMYEIPKAHRRALFEGYRFFITNHHSILPPVKDLKKIIECAGGQAIITGEPKADDIVITTENALTVASIQKTLMGVGKDRMHTSELILSSILQQQIDLAAHIVKTSENQMLSKNASGKSSSAKRIKR